MRCDHPPETLGPHRLVTELLAPGPQSARRMMQGVLVGKTHGTVHLMGDRGTGSGRFAAAHLGDRHFADADLGTETGLCSGVRSRTRRSHLARQYCQIVL